MLRKWKILCDIDDTLWPLNVTVTRRFGIPMEKMVEFHIMENPLLTPTERKLVSEAFSDPRTFQCMEFYPGVEKLLGLEELGIQLEFPSNSFGREIAQNKHANMLRAIPGVREDQICLRVIDPSDTKKKPLPENTLILIDDSPYTVAKSPAKLNILPKWPYNVTEKARDMMVGKDLCYVEPGNIPQLVDVLHELIPHLLRKHGAAPP